MEMQQARREEAGQLEMALGELKRKAAALEQESVEKDSALAQVTLAGTRRRRQAFFGLVKATGQSVALLISFSMYHFLIRPRVLLTGFSASQKAWPMV